ncbi:putative peptidoglycan glycosyltransferase FtsW [Microbacterium sp. ARD32]|uniref:peptidoglycan glycosyltransferase FtsW n=1 Tax=Microbacterium sp. ARD32 TaxID=2962577 RepID=UPI0028821D8E|nr:putative peptidoglycan glycosyltransferase FtsW [Microbacterium sp. ARD32]MDT0157534.1 putative peptidoglycan glycosyltransferase FtsW [Microbacterium sp. ARD32]
MTQTAHPPRADGRSAIRGLAARVSLGRLFSPPSTEFVMIASTAVLLTIFGVVMVLSASSANPSAPYQDALRQGLFALVGIPLMLIVSRLPVVFFKRIAWPALILGVLFQLLVFVPGLGVSSYGNKNWIKIAGIQLQPSEFLKLALAVWIACVLMRKQSKLGTWHQVFVPVVPVAVLAIGTVIAGDDLGTVMVLVLVVLGCLFFSGARLRLFIIPLLLGAVVVAGYALTSENRMNRILSAFNPEACDPTVDCYQSVHGMWGMANGGIFGLGLGNSQEKYWLPAASNDFIFAIIGEELGLLGCLLVLVLFGFFAVGVFRIIRRTVDPFVRIAAGGIVVWIVGQALFNIGVVVRIFPVMGVPLPFVSQGGTSLLSAMLACGVLLSFARTLPPVASRRVTGHR